MAWLASKRLIFHHAKFDLHMFAAGLRLDPEGGQNLWNSTTWDTKIGNWLLWPLESTSLKTSATRLALEGGGEDMDQQVLKARLRQNPVGQRQRYDLLRWEEIKDYAETDARLTYLLFERQQDELELRPELRPFIDRELRMARVLFDMERRGIGFDQEAAARGAVILDKVLAEVVAELPFRFTPPAAGEWFFEEQRAIPHCVTAKAGKPSLAECCIKSLVVQGGVVGDQARRYARAQKIKSALTRYYRGWAEQVGEDGRLRTSFKQDGTISMRFAVERVQLQAIPHDYRFDAALPPDVPMPRFLLKAAPGSRLWDFDLAQAEYRVAGRMAQCGRILGYIRDGIDAHSATSDLLFGRHDEQWRQVAKRANFSLLFNIGSRKFNQDVEKQTGIVLGETRARDIVQNWRRLHPEIPRMNQVVEQAALARMRANPGSGGYVRLINGRIRWFAWNEHSYKAFNQVVQGSIAELTKEWLLRVDEAFPGMIVLTTHDSMTMEIPVDQEAEVVAEVVKIGGTMATEWFNVPMEAEAKPWTGSDAVERHLETRK